MPVRQPCPRAAACSYDPPGCCLRPAGAAAWAQKPLDWPNRVVRIVVPVAAGGPTDTVARVLADQLSKIWGHQVVVENKGGAGTNLGNEMAARADPDGYTVLFATSSLAINRSLYRSLSYDPLADLLPVSLISRFPLFMFVPNSSPANCRRCCRCRRRRCRRCGDCIVRCGLH